ncbi:MAG: hypothetical protein OXL96_28585 [Candidatus Poribacteria bacterium]|nr:hypothetical protein [Candidatus Poribacteria bacterium]
MLSLDQNATSDTTDLGSGDSRKESLKVDGNMGPEYDKVYPCACCLRPLDLSDEYQRFLNWIYAGNAKRRNDAGG